MKSVLIILLTIIIGASLFYWLQIRPAQIKHDCSWVKYFEAAKPAYSALTEGELQVKGLIEDCTIMVLDPDSTFWKLEQSLASDCKRNNKKIIEEYSIERDAIPAKEKWRKANKEEYQFCLHDKGL